MGSRSPSTSVTEQDFNSWKLPWKAAFAASVKSNGKRLPTFDFFPSKNRHFWKKIWNQPHHLIFIKGFVLNWSALSFHRVTQILSSTEPKWCPLWRDPRGLNWNDLKRLFIGGPKKSNDDWLNNVKHPLDWLVKMVFVACLHIGEVGSKTRPHVAIPVGSHSCHRCFSRVLGDSLGKQDSQGVSLGHRRWCFWSTSSRFTM